MRLITTALVLAALGVLLLPTVSAGQEGRLTGSLPRDGGIALAVWGGGPIEELVLEAGAGGCSTVSVWTTPEGEGFVGYIPTVVEAVNARFFETYSGGVLPQTPVLIVCQAGEPLVPELEVSGLTFDILDFGESCVGCIVERVVGLRNVGTAATRIHDIRVTSAFGDEGAFVVGAGCVGVWS